MATIRTRKGVRGTSYQAIIRLMGTAVRKSFDRKTDARAWAAKTESDIRAGNRPQTGQRGHGHSFAEAVERFFEEVVKVRWAETTKRSRSFHVRVLDEYFGEKALHQITIPLIHEIMERMRNERGLGPGTMRGYHTALSAILEAAKSWGWIQGNPCRDITAPTPPPGRCRFLTDDERSRLLAACDKSPDAWLGNYVRLALYTGMRRGELLSLRWANVDLDAKVIRLEALATKARRARAIPICQPALDILDRMHSEAHAASSDELFMPGSPHTSKETRHAAAFAVAVKVAGIEDFKGHDCRHDCASALAQKGVSLQVIGAILGHSTPAMSQRYAHLLPSTLADAMDKTFKGYE